MRKLSLAAWLLSCASIAYAEPPASRGHASTFWGVLTHPRHARADALVRQGRALLAPALGLGFALAGEAPLQRRLAIESALARFDRALALAPDHREARLARADALALWEEPRAHGAPKHRSEEAIDALTALRELDPTFAPYDVAFALGVLFTRTGAFERAAAEYERALAVWAEDGSLAGLLGNLAEVTMLRGDLTGALACYERALHESDDASRPLVRWGRAVALDRLGERGEALHEARRALREDRAPMAALRRGGVFFEPPYERAYYEGLGQRARAELARTDSEPLVSLLTRALRVRASSPERVRALDALEDGAGAAQQALVRVLRQRLLSPTLGPDLGERPGEASTAEERALIAVLSSLAAFSRFVADAGDDAPFVEDAREHVTALTTMLRAALADARRARPAR